MKAFQYIFVLIALTSCKHPAQQTPIAHENLGPPQLHIQKVEENFKRYNDRVFFGGTGTSFGNFMQALFRQSRYLDMLQFTSTISRREFGDKKILGFYSRMNFGFELGKLTAIQKVDSTNQILIYNNAHINATRRKITLEITSESDSVKLVLRSLKNPFQYLIK